LSETLYESALYMSGRQVLYGDPGSVAASRDPGDPSYYDSPMDYSCQKNFVVLLTDGEPTRDYAADGEIVAMQDAAGDSFSSLVGNTCDAETYPSGFSPTGGECLDDLAEFLYDGDHSTLSGQQNVTTYTVGFTVDLPILADTAERGGGVYYTADDTATLASALSSIVTSILTTNTTFTVPTVAVNAFNRTQNLSDLFISVFRPSGRAHWPGNLKKYRLNAGDATIVDADGNPAIDPGTGFFADTARSFWSLIPDGPNVEDGGAALQLQQSAGLLSSTSLAATPRRRTNQHHGRCSTRAPSAILPDQIIDFIRGRTPDTDQDDIRTTPQMGDRCTGRCP
jgi:type IV pilus assembly protein PilY1